MSVKSRIEALERQQRELRERIEQLKASIEPEFDQSILVPDGIYRAKIEEVEAVISKSGRHMWRIVYVLTEDPYAGKRVWDHQVEIPWLPIVQLARTLGIPLDPVWPDRLQWNYGSPTDMIGHEVMIRVDENQWQDRKMNVVKEVIGRPQ